MLLKKRSMTSKSSSSKTRSYKLQKKYCSFGMCPVAPKWKAYGVLSKDVVQYSNLLKQKNKFQQLLKINESRISCRKNSCCIVDKNYSSKGSIIDILIFDENEHHIALYLEYFVDKQTILKNCNNLLSFLNLKKTSMFYIDNSFIYVKSADGLKWELFYDLFEFLLKKHNKCVLGSQFYFPLISKCLIMNELRFSYLLQNISESLKFISMKISGQSWETPISGLSRKGLPTKKPRIMSTIKNFKKSSVFFTTEVNNRTENLIGDIYASQTFNLKRKAAISNENKRKIKRLSFESFESSCHCQSKSKHEWKVYKPFDKTPIINYSGILKAKNWLDDSSTARTITFDSNFDGNSIQHLNSLVNLNKDSLTVCNISKRESSLVLDKVPNVKNMTDVYFSEAVEQSKFKHTSDLCTLKEIVPAFHNEQSPVITNPQHYQVSSANTKNVSNNLGSRITKSISEDKGNIAGSSKQTSQLGFVSFHTAHGKTLKISEKALKAAEKMFKEVCSEELDISDKKEFESVLKNNKRMKGFDAANKYADEDYQICSANLENVSKDLDSRITKNSIEEKEKIAGPSKDPLQLGFVSFHTAHGKALKISEKALKVAEKMFEEVCAEELDVSDIKKIESALKNHKKREEFDSKNEVYIDEDINNILAENFFEDIPFDERETECKPPHMSTKSPLMKSDILKPTQNQKKRKSLGGRRCLKPFTLNK